MVENFGPIPTTPKGFIDGGFTLKTHEMFSVHTTPDEFENVTITGHFRFVCEEDSAWKSHDYRDV